MIARGIQESMWREDYEVRQEAKVTMRTSNLAVGNSFDADTRHAGSTSANHPAGNQILQNGTEHPMH